MSLSDPLSFFDIKGKVALITGASGAFGAVAAECLSGAGCKVALAAGNAEAMAEVAGRCKGETHQINARPDSDLCCGQCSAAGLLEPEGFAGRQVDTVQVAIDRECLA